jgi:hypothetical protein
MGDNFIRKSDHVKRVHLNTYHILVVSVKLSNIIHTNYTDIIFR